MMIQRIAILLTVSCVLVGIGTDHPRAMGMYFDALGTTSTWDATGLNWSTWGGGPYDKAWVSGSDAHFEGTPGTVDIADDVTSVNGVTFETDGYRLTGVLNLTGPSGRVWTSGGVDTIDAVITGTKGLTKGHAGTLILGGANTFTGDTRLIATYSSNPLIGDGGTLELNNPLALQNSNLDASTQYDAKDAPDKYATNLSFGTLTNATLGGLKGTGVRHISLTNSDSLGVALSVGNNNQSTQFGGSLTGMGSLTKIGSGTLTLTGDHSYTGGTFINEGTLQLGTSTGFTGSLAGDITNNATLVLKAWSWTTFPNSISGTGTVIVDGFSPTVELTGTNTYTGETIVKGGSKLRVNSMKGDVTLLDNSSMYLTGPGNICYGTVRGTGSIYPSRSIIAGDVESTVSIRLDSQGSNYGVSVQIGDGIHEAPHIAGDIIATNFMGYNTSPAFRSQVVFPCAQDQTYDGSIHPDTYFGGSCDLIKRGAGTLTLTGTNDLDHGFTVVEEGTLHVTGSLKGHYWGRSGAALTRRIAAGASYSGNYLQFDDGTGLSVGVNFFDSTDVALIAAGIASSTTDVRMSWHSATEAEKNAGGGTLMGAVFDLSGIAAAPATTDATDAFVLYLNYDPTILTSMIGVSEAEVASDKLLQLSCWDSASNDWLQATALNFGNNASAEQMGFVGSYGSFKAQYGDNLGSQVGAFGYDLSSHAAWAVLNHNSEFALTVVPEPSTLALLFVALAASLARPIARFRRSSTLSRTG